MSKAKTVKGEKMSEEPTERILPSFSLNETDLPAIKRYKVGKKYKLEIEVEVKELRKGNMWGNDKDKELKAGFRVTKVKSIDKGEENYEEQYADMMGR